MQKTQPREDKPKQAGREAVSDETLEIIGLPSRQDPATWVEETPSERVPDPDGGRDPDRDFMLRNIGF